MVVGREEERELELIFGAFGPLGVWAVLGSNMEI